MKFYALIALCLFSTSVHALDRPSLFFTKDELKTIEHKLEAQPAPKPKRQKHLLRLDSILYIDEDHWVVWIQNNKITPDNQWSKHRVMHVSPNSLRIVAKLQNGHVVTKTLLLHQSLDLITGDIVEEAMPPARQPEPSR